MITIPYLGKDDTRQTKGLGGQVILQLVEPYRNKEYHVTTDQFFTSLSLTKKLPQSKISLLGTIRSDRREVTKLTKQQFTSSFYHTEDGILDLLPGKEEQDVLSVIDTIRLLYHIPRESQEEAEYHFVL